jgi:hypothetical protein
MSDFNDPSFEMHNDTLSSEEVENLINGTSERPELAELANLFAEVRSFPKMTDTPAPSAALSEFVGVTLTHPPEPIMLPDADDTPVLSATGAEAAKPVRRNTMIGHVAAFMATMSGKVVIGTTVAAASIGGAHATGAVDVPFLPDNKPAVIETIEVPADPDALAFVEDELESSEPAKEESPEASELDQKDEEKLEDDDAFEDDVKFTEDDLPEHKLTTDENHELEEKEVVEIETPKVEKEEAKNEEPREEPTKDAKTAEEEAAQVAMAALEEAVHVAKDKVRAEAKALINPLEEERDGLLAALEEAHHLLAVEWEGVIEALEIELEGTDDEGERAAIEEDIAAAEQAWADARVAAELEVDPRLEEINDLLGVIETERDAEIDRLLNEFLAAVEEIKNG